MHRRDVPVRRLRVPEGGGLMPSEYADGLVHGHCRYGECSCVLAGEWVDRHTWTPECFSAPPSPCVCCSGAGLHRDMHTVKPYDCGPCRASGMLPGPHWPWRHAEPPPLRAPGGCAGLAASRAEKPEHKKDGQAPTRPHAAGGRWVDPRTLGFYHGVKDPAAVEFYRNNPDGRYAHDSDPTRVSVINGRPMLNEGRHRAEAAIREGRQLWIDDWREAP